MRCPTYGRMECELDASVSCYPVCEIQLGCNEPGSVFQFTTVFRFTSSTCSLYLILLTANASVKHSEFALNQFKPLAVKGQNLDLYRSTKSLSVNRLLRTGVDRKTSEYLIPRTARLGILKSFPNISNHTRLASYLFLAPKLQRFPEISVENDTRDEVWKGFSVEHWP